MALQPRHAPVLLLLLLLLLLAGGSARQPRPPLNFALKAVQAVKGREDALHGRRGSQACASAAAVRNAGTKQAS